MYTGSPLIATCFIYGDSLQDKLVAIVVPDEAAVQLFASKPENKVKAGGAAPLAQLCKEAAVVKAIRRDMERLGEEAQLKGFEKARAVHLEPEPFSVDNGLLTPTFKLKRAPARDHYRAVIDRMYEELNGSKQPKSKL